MTVGSVVAYCRDPSLYGQMVIVEICKDGWLLCHDAAGEQWDFRPDEVDDASRFYVPPTAG